MDRVRLGLAVGLLVAGASLTACANDEPLSTMGHMTERWIAAAPDSTTSTTVPGVPAPLGLLVANEPNTLDWVNDGLGDRSVASPGEVVVAVWSRSNQDDQYIQASRLEIATALPGIEFPGLIPQNVAFVTSQLVFDPATGELASDPVAAFGLWSVKPYTRNRSVAQLGVLMVSVDEERSDPVVVDTIGVPEDPPEDTRCDELTNGTVEECKPVTLEDGCPAWSLDVSDGWRLAWSEGGYQYDLFVRNAGDADLLAGMAGSCEELAPVVSVLAGADTPGAEPAKSESPAPVQPSDS